MPSSAAHRDIPPELVYGTPDLPPSFGEGAALLVDKPDGMTSFDVVKRVRTGTCVKKVGHAGTLDPKATGLLIVLVARPATRLQESFMHLPKTYVGTMRLGERTASHDAETDVVSQTDPSSLTREEIEGARAEFLGTIQQVPPMYSAVKVEGERLYKKARRGETVERPPREVRIDEFDLIEWTGSELHFRVECTKGTYIRSLARDMGEVLGVGAHLTALRREGIGRYSVEDAWRLSALDDALTQRKADES